MAGELSQQALRFQRTGETQPLIGESSGIVAIVGLYHVTEGRVQAREVLEAAPDLILEAARDPKTETYADRLADATEQFCVEATEEATETEELLKRYQDHSLEILATRALHGNEHDINQLVARCVPLAYYIIKERGLYLPNGDREDLCQEGLLGLTKGLQTYDPTRGRFSSFAYLTMYRQMVTAVKTSTRGKHQVLTGARSLDAPVEESSHLSLGETTPRPAPEMDDSLANRQLLGAYWSALSPFEQKVTAYFLQGFNYSEIAQSLGSHTKSVDNALQRSRRKLANARHVAGFVD